MNPANRRKNQPNYASKLAKKNQARKDRLNSPLYFDTSAGIAFLSTPIESDYGFSALYYSVATGWQKTPWLGFGLNYSISHNPGYHTMKTLGVSWRARPGIGYFKATVNMIGQYEMNVRVSNHDSYLKKNYAKTMTPLSLELEVGVRVWHTMLIKAGYMVQKPFDSRVRSELTLYNHHGGIKTLTTEMERVRLGYFHIGIGFIL